MNLFLFLALCKSAEALGNFSFQEAKKFARLAQLAYCPDNMSSVRDWTCSGCIDSQVPVEGSVHYLLGGVADNAQFLYAKMADQPGCFISIRGSHNVMNAVRDISFLPKHDSMTLGDCDGCKVHTGFNTIWTNMKNSTIAGLSDVGCTPDTNNMIYITGHSLGAAVASLAAFDLAKNGWNVAKIYTFESPRLGNKKFVAAFNDLFQGDRYRITHSYDPVVHLPPTAFGFYHASTEVYFDEAGSYFVCRGSEDGNCSDSHSNVPYDLLFVLAEHCGNSGFGPGFNFCWDPRDLSLVPEACYISPASEILV